MRLIAEMPWQEPLEFCSGIQEDTWCLLYSGSRFPHTGQRSLLGVGVKETLQASSLASFNIPLSEGGHAYDRAWFGYVGYEAADIGAPLPHVMPTPVPLPGVLWLRFATIVEFDHTERRIRLFGERWDRPEPSPSKSEMPKVGSFCSSMTTEAYKAKVEALRQSIMEGEVYQANLTRKFYGAFESAPEPFALFQRLMEISPTPYAAFLKHGETAILSASMERFLTIDSQGHIETRPIKGSAARGLSPNEDERIVKWLESSAKNRSENLMIVDLMRNDLARVCVPGSVRVDKLFEVTTYPTVHHMSSTVTGQLARGSTPMDALRACFPPGSMTGAPKIAAMKRCAALEGVARGVYSGCMGWLGGDGGADLSVIIRTLVMQRERFEFQVGGAILWESDAKEELEETLTKAKGIAAVLNLPLAALRDL